MKKLIIILILLMGSSVFSQTYTLNPRMDSLKAYILYQLRASSTDAVYADDVIEKAINRAVALVCMDFPALPKVDTVVIDSDSTGGALNADFIRASNVLKFYDSLWVPMEQMVFTGARDKFPTEDNNTHKKSSFEEPGYYYFHQRKLYTHPKDLKPAADPDSFIVFYYAMDDELSDDTMVTVIEAAYLEPMILKACEILSGMARKFDQAEYYALRYKGLKE